MVRSSPQYVGRHAAVTLYVSVGITQPVGQGPHAFVVVTVLVFGQHEFLAHVSQLPPSSKYTKEGTTYLQGTVTLVTLI